MDDPESAEIRERFARIDKFQSHGGRGPNHVDRDSLLRGWGGTCIRVDENKFGELWTRGNASWMLQVME